MSMSKNQYLIVPLWLQVTKSNYGERQKCESSYLPFPHLMNKETIKPDIELIFQNVFYPDQIFQCSKIIILITSKCHYAGVNQILKS